MSMDFAPILQRQTDRIKTDDDLAEFLEHLLFGGWQFEIRQDGTVGLYSERFLVARVGDFRVIIKADEHPPPHFHMVSDSQGLNASLSILDLEPVVGCREITPKQMRALKAWYFKGGGRKMLIKKWNETRPADCQVGPIIDA